MVERVLYTALSDSMTALFLSAQLHHFFAPPNLWILVSGFWPLRSGSCGLWPRRLVGSSARWLIGSLARLLVGSSARWLVGLLAHWLIGSLARRLIGSLACWLVDSDVLLTVTCVAVGGGQINCDLLRNTTQPALSTVRELPLGMNSV